MTAIIEQSQTITIRRETYERLQERAVPFEDTTPDTVIAKLLDQTGDNAPETVPLVGPKSNGSSSLGETANTHPDVDIVVDDPLDPPSLKHTKVLRAEVDGRELAKANWSSVRQGVLEIALGQRGYDLRRLQQVCAVNAVAQVKNDEGYAYYDHLGVSIQGQDAGHAWQATAGAARALGVAVSVWFQWRSKPDAVHPGKRGLLTIR